MENENKAIDTAAKKKPDMDKMVELVIVIMPSYSASVSSIIL